MMTPIPAQVLDPKDAVLWSVLNSLEQIDMNTSSRAIYAQSVLFNITANLDAPCFKEEIAQIRAILGVKCQETIAEAETPAIRPMEGDRTEAVSRMEL